MNYQEFVSAVEREEETRPQAVSMSRKRFYEIVNSDSAPPYRQHLTHDGFSLAGVRVLPLWRSLPPEMVFIKTFQNDPENAPKPLPEPPSQRENGWGG